MDSSIVPKGMYMLYHEERKRYRKISKVYQSSTLLRLPPEVQVCIGQWVSRLGNGNSQNRTGNTFLSREIYNFRLVSKKLASVGASVIALHARNTPHSSYKSILFDFTDRSLQVLEAVSKQSEFTTSISSVYFILWRFNPEILDDSMESAKSGSLTRSNFNEVELVERWQQRQQFFQSDKLLKLEAVLDKFTNLVDYQWIENDCTANFFNRRPRRYASSLIQLPGRQAEDSFTRMLASYSSLQRRIDCLTSIFENLTHLHILGTAGPCSWSPDNLVWESLIDNMMNLTCLRLEAAMNAQISLTVLTNATLPRLKKLILKHFQGAAHVITRHVIARFLKKHASNLKDIRFAYLGLSDVEHCHLLVEMRKLVSHATVSVIYHNHHNDLTHAAIDDRMRTFLAHGRGAGAHDHDYGRCVMKSTPATSPYDDSPSKINTAHSNKATGIEGGNGANNDGQSDRESTISPVNIDDDDDEMNSDNEIDDDGMGFSDEDEEDDD